MIVNDIKLGFNISRELADRIHFRKKLLVLELGVLGDIHSPGCNQGGVTCNSLNLVS